MSGMFHTLKDALPTFEEGQTGTISGHGFTSGDGHEVGVSISKSFLFPGNI
jgi:hypothetical protein